MTTPNSSEKSEPNPIDILFPLIFFAILGALLFGVIGASVGGVFGAALGAAVGSRETLEVSEDSTR